MLLSNWLVTVSAQISLTVWTLAKVTAPRACPALFEHMQLLHVLENITFYSVFNCLRPFRDFNHITIGSWIWPHTAKFQTDRKRSTKKIIFYFQYAKVKVTKVQNVLKTDQRAEVSAHDFFSAHEIQLLGPYDFQRSCSLLIKTSKNVSFIL